MMSGWTVIDFGAVCSPELRDFFTASPANVAVLTDMLALEALKQRGLERYKRSLEILSDNSGRVLILKPTAEAARLRPSALDFPRNLIDTDATIRFPHFCARVLSAGINEAKFLEKRQERARSFATRVAEQANLLREAIDSLNTNFSEGMLRDLRANRKSMSDPAVIAFLNQSADRIAYAKFMAQFPGKELPQLDDLHSWFPHRYSLALVTLGVKWCVAGGLPSASIDKLRNDGLDMVYAAYGSAFGGLLSGDKKMIELFRLLRAALVGSA